MVQRIHGDLGAQYDDVEYRSHCDEIAANQKVGANEVLQNQKRNRKSQWYHPKWESIKLEEFLQCGEVVLQRPGQASRHLHARLKQEVTHATNASDEDVAGEEANERAQSTYTHQEEHQASENGADREGKDSRRNH